MPATLAEEGGGTNAADIEIRPHSTSRFLIRGGCANLASHVLGQVLRRLPQDFRQRYGYSPWLVS